MKVKLKILFAAFGLVVSFKCMAEGNVELFSSNYNGSQKPRSEIPVVSYTDSTITVSSDSIINNVEVVLKDASGNIVCSDTVDATPCGSSITVPSGIDGGGYAVELYYDEKHLYGYIE